MYLPNSTYRIQLQKKFNFRHLEEVLEYLHKLGISAIYASPITSAVEESVHCYDGINPHEVNPEIGTIDQWLSIDHRLKQYKMGWLQDIVPNHMAYTAKNKWVFDMLERGRNSKYYYYFDLISQQDQPEPGEMKIMLPFLNSDLEAAVRNKEVNLNLASDGIFVIHGKENYPISPATFGIIAGFTKTSQSLKDWCERVQSVNYPNLPLEEWIAHKTSHFKELLANDQLEQELTGWINETGQRPDLFLQLLHCQHYKFTHWKQSQQTMNYRRFFAVNTLICLRIQDKNVFDEWHENTARLFNRGLIQGFRVDHVDGMFDPEGYLTRLRKLMGDQAYIVSEKILQENEQTISSWPVQGTSGYEFLSSCNQLLCDTNGKSKLIEFYNATVSKTSYPEVVFEKKYAFLKKELNGELANLIRWLIPWLDVNNIDTDIETLREALAIFMSCFPVYRIYVRELPVQITDKEFIQQAFEAALVQRPELAEDFHILEKVFATNPEHSSAKHALLFIQRFAQYTAPLAAKGVEDTSFYCYNPLISHNEVGDSPAHRPVDVGRFHELMLDRNQHANFSMNATSTHDTKRGEDNRLRINLITQYPEEWISLLEEVRKVAEPFIHYKGERRIPSLNDEYFIYQALVGSLPPDLNISDTFLIRLKEYLSKAQREERVNTNWNEPDEEYENYSFQFTMALLQESAFQDLFFPFVHKIISDSLVYSLTQTLLKLTTPGIPDIFQGAELWDLTFVDPDNRALIDFNLRTSLLNQLIQFEKGSIDQALSFAKEHAMQGAEKMFLIKQVLNFRNAYPEIFNEGDYIPAPCAKGWIAFTRKTPDHEILVCAPVPIQNRKQPRSIAPVSSKKEQSFIIRGDRTEVIPAMKGKWKNIITAEEILLSDYINPDILTKNFPVAVLIAVS